MVGLGQLLGLVFQEFLGKELCPHLDLGVRRFTLLHAGLGGGELFGHGPLGGGHLPVHQGGPQGCTHCKGQKPADSPRQNVHVNLTEMILTTLLHRRVRE